MKSNKSLATVDEGVAPASEQVSVPEPAAEPARSSGGLQSTLLADALRKATEGAIKSIEERRLQYHQFQKDELDRRCARRDASILEATERERQALEVAKDCSARAKTLIEENAKDTAETTAMMDSEFSKFTAMIEGQRKVLETLNS